VSAAVAVPSAYLLVLRSLAAPEEASPRVGSAEDQVRHPRARARRGGRHQTHAEAFETLDYPSELLSAHVVADNCVDGTGGVATGDAMTRPAAPDDPGKGPALNWLLDRLVASGEPFDAIVIVDADTTVAPGFLRAMDEQVRAGVEAAQGFYSVRDPDLSTASSFRESRRPRPTNGPVALGGSRLGAPCLYGNGMTFTRSLFEGRRWTGHLVEDAEFQNELLLDGHLVTYVPDAVVWAEMPHTSSRRPARTNDGNGRIEMAQRYVPMLLGGLVLHAGAASRRRRP
jgi:hypothetical protein